MKDICLFLSKVVVHLPGIRLFYRVTLLIATLGVFAAWAEESLPEGQGADLTSARCRPCHEISIVTASAGISRAMWDQVLKDMERLGMRLSEEEYDVILNYLSTYLGPNPPPPGTVVDEPEPSAEPSGSRLYERFCSTCHGDDGRGLEQVPPLAGNPHLKDPQYNVLVVLYGLSGPIKVDNRRFEGLMPSFSQLSDAEIADVAEYVIAKWGNAPPPDSASIRPEQVKQARSKDLEPAEVVRFRPKLQ